MKKFIRDMAILFTVVNLLSFIIGGANLGVIFRIAICLIILLYVEKGE